MLDAIERFRAAYPDLTTDIEYVVADGDLVGVLGRWRGTDPGNGRSFNVLAIGFDRMVDGRSAESWLLLDTAAIQDQLGG